MSDDYEWEMEQHGITVAQLIVKLQAMPQDAKVFAIYDGFCSVDPDHVWVTRKGHVVMIDANAPCYHDSDRPPWAPLEKDESNWYTPELPSGSSER